MVASMILPALLLLVLAVNCSAFAPPSRTSSIAKSKCDVRNHDVLLMAQKMDGGGSDLDSFISSLPDIKDNIMEGKIGERGEQYVIVQFSLLLFIAIGSIPLVGDLLPFLGPLFILAGLFVVYRAAADLKDNLSPWPVPAESGRGSLINGGIYSSMRHPMYSGLLLGMTGLSLATDSITRLVLTCGLYFVLDAKSDYEETKLIERWGEEYKDYQVEVKGKLIPSGIKELFNR